MSCITSITNLFLLTCLVLVWCNIGSSLPQQRLNIQELRGDIGGILGNVYGYDDSGQPIEYEDSMTDDWNGYLQMPKRGGWQYPKRRGMNKCGQDTCAGRCCGRNSQNPICCKKDWTCRYKPRSRSFACIP